MRGVRSMIRYGMERDFERAKKIWRESFLDSEDEVEFYFENLYDRHKYLILEEDDEIKASLHENPYRLNFNGSVFDSIYIVGVAVSPEYRGKGYMNQLLRESLIESRKRGIPFLFLSPINPEIYRKYGFEYVSRLTKYSLKTQSIPYSRLERAYDIKSVVLNSEDEMYKDLIEVYEEQMRDFSLYIQRDEKYYRDWVREIKSDGGDIFSIYLDGKIEGYVAFYRREKLEIREIFAKDRRSLENLLAFIKTFKEYYPELEIKNLEGKSLEYLFSNQKSFEKREYPFIMGRILNPMEVFKMMNIYDIDIKILVTDSLIVENNGVYRFTQEGEASYEEIGDWDIKIDIGDLSALVFGQLSIEELIFLEKLEVKNPEVLKRLKEKSIFTLKRNYIQDYQ